MRTKSLHFSSLPAELQLAFTAYHSQALEQARLRRALALEQTEAHASAAED